MASERTRPESLIWAALFLIPAGTIIMAETELPARPAAFRGLLDPVGKIHIPIGIADTVDTLKTFVEAEGCFSPGFCTYGVYFWVHDAQSGKLTAPTMRGVKCDRGLGAGGHLIPWTSWGIDGLTVKTEVCEVQRKSDAGPVFVVGSRAHLTNTGEKDRRISLYVALRSLGPAGGLVESLAVSDAGDALLVDGHPALVANEKPDAAGVSDTDDVGESATAGKMPAEKKAASKIGDCSGALRFDLTIPAGKTRTLGLVCPVLPGRRAVGHKWDGKSPWAQLDEAKPNPPDGGVPQPDPGLDYCRKLSADALFQEAQAYWKDLVGRSSIQVADSRWAECFAAIVGHVAMSMNEGAPDVAAVNYNVFNRDGVYAANILQKSGRFDLAARAIDYFLAHPFNGRVHPEADNPGQVLWIMGEHWRFTGDKDWLGRVYPSAKKLAGMIQYYRTTTGPHWVCPTSLDFGEALPKDKRQELKPGSCDGHHPEYTEAFDIAGLRGAAVLAEAAGESDDAKTWTKLADSLTDEYDRKFGKGLPKGYGSYSVLWPCRLYPLNEGKGYEQFKDARPRGPDGWRYFALASAHQGLLTGGRSAGADTINQHLNHEQMRGWYAFDEGGQSGPGGWKYSRTTWDSSVAMPHGWAIAEMWLLLRDCFLFEDNRRLVLLSGVPGTWFTGGPIVVENLPTYFGPCSFTYRQVPGGATLELRGKAAPPMGFVLRLPATLKAKVSYDGKPITPTEAGNYRLPANAKTVKLEYSN